MDLYYPLHGSNLLCNAWLQPCVLTTYNSLPASHFERAATLRCSPELLTPTLHLFDASDGDEQLPPSFHILPPEAVTGSASHAAAPPAVVALDGLLQDAWAGAAAALGARPRCTASATVLVGGGLCPKQGLSVAG